MLSKDGHVENPHNFDGNLRLREHEQVDSERFSQREVVGDLLRGNSCEQQS